MSPRVASCCKWCNGHAHATRPANGRYSGPQDKATPHEAYTAHTLPSNPAMLVLTAAAACKHRQRYREYSVMGAAMGIHITRPTYRRTTDAGGHLFEVGGKFVVESSEGVAELKAAATPLRLLRLYEKSHDPCGARVRDSGGGGKACETHARSLHNKSASEPPGRRLLGVYEHLAVGVACDAKGGRQEGMLHLHLG